jgi:hypothetical protein
VPQVSIQSPSSYDLFILDNALEVLCVYLANFADDKCLYATNRKEGFVVRKLQPGLTSMETWCERWNIQIYDDNPQGIYFNLNRRPPESHLALNGRNIPLLCSVIYHGVIFDKKVTGRLHVEIMENRGLQNSY